MQQYFEIQSNFSPVLNTAIALMRQRGHIDICNILSESNISIINTDYDNWNGGTYGYTVYIGLSIKKYSMYSSEDIEDIEKIISASLNEAIKGDENNYFCAQISPTLSNVDIDWDIIGGVQGKIALKQKIETVKSIMVSVATNGSLVKDEESRYKKNQTEIVNNCKKLNLTYNNFYESLWDWRGKWKADFPTYQERRIYINKLFALTLEYFDEEENNDMETFVQLDDWERIKRTITKIKRDSNVAANEEDFQTIGLLCRDVIISLAQAVYNPLIHGTTDENGIQIGNSDAVRMIGNYITSMLDGRHNKELRAYAKTTNDLANQLTHKRTATKKDMLLTMSSTIALINLIGIIDDRF